MLKESVEEGKKFGLNSTPTFVINNRLVSGAPPLDRFKKIIDEELEKAREKQLGNGRAEPASLANRPDKIERRKRHFFDFPMDIIFFLTDAFLSYNFTHSNAGLGQNRMESYWN